MKNYQKIFAALSLCVCLLATAFAQSGGTYVITQSVIAGGGGKSTETNGMTTFSVEGTVGQGVAGTTSTSSSPQYSLRGGFWVSQPLAPTAAGVSVGGRVMTAAGMPIGGVRVSLIGSDGESRVAITNPFGYYRFDDVEVGRTYLIEASSKRFEFVPRSVTILDELRDEDLVALP